MRFAKGKGPLLRREGIKKNDRLPVGGPGQEGAMHGEDWPRESAEGTENTVVAMDWWGGGHCLPRIVLVRTAYPSRSPERLTM